MIQISAVSYLNTLPFIHGIEHSGLLNPNEFKLIRDIPSSCARKLETRGADIILVPVAALANFKDYDTITDYCIGANDNVLSVLLVSQQPIHEITRIYLDYQSRTSVNLVKVLAKNFWKKGFIWEDTKPGYESEIRDTSGGVIIGDRALELANNYRYKYDLATEWNKFTKFPFVFACWVSLNEIDPDFLLRFNNSLKWGIEHLQDINPNYPNLSNTFIKDYFRNNIDYVFDQKKRQGMELFFSYLKDIS